MIIKNNTKNNNRHFSEFSLFSQIKICNLFKKKVPIVEIGATGCPTNNKSTRRLEGRVSSLLKFAIFYS